MHERKSASRLPRRGVLRAAALATASLLLAACGQEPRSTAGATSPTLTPAPTRILPVPTPAAASSVATPTPPAPVALLWKAEQNLLHPGHLALDGQGNVYVTDDEHQRVVKFDTGGHFVLAWGARGTGDGQFVFRSAHQDHSPIAGIALSDPGEVSVADSTTRLQVFDPDGTYLRQWSVAGPPGPLPTIPAGLAHDGRGNLYVVDTNNHRVLKFTDRGQFLAMWGGTGSGDGQFSVPSAVACDRQGNVYVVDINNARVQVFDDGGALLRRWGASGFEQGHFLQPSGIAVEATGDVFVADTGNQRIQRFTGAGQFVAAWGTRGAEDGEMHDPTDVAADGQGNVYVADDSNNRVLKFRLR